MLIKKLYGKKAEFERIPGTPYQIVPKQDLIPENRLSLFLK
jgi:hypothetical protein